MEINKTIESCGYQGVGDADVQAIESCVGQATFRLWLEDCRQLRDASAHWNGLRSVLMAVSPVVTRVLTDLQVQSSAKARVQIFLASGKPLRAAIAVFVSQKDPDKCRQAGKYITQAFATAQPEHSEIDNKVHRIFASKAAVVFEHAKTRGGRGCLQVEAAGRQDRTQSFSWNTKIALQLSDAEAMQVLAVLRGWMTSVELANHGTDRDKRLTLSKQASGAGYLVSVRQGSMARVVPLPPFEAYRVISLTMKVLAENSPHLDPEMIAQMCQELAAQ